MNRDTRYLFFFEHRHKVPRGEEFDELSDGESREGGDERVVCENGEIMSRGRRRSSRILHGADD